MGIKEDYEDGKIDWKEYLEQTIYRYCLWPLESELSQDDKEFMANLKKPMCEIDLPLAPSPEQDAMRRERQRISNLPDDQRAAEKIKAMNAALAHFRSLK